MSEHDEARGIDLEFHHMSENAAQCFGSHARKLSRILSRHYDTALCAHNITLTQFTLLIKIASRPGIIARTLEKEERTEKSTMSRTLARLVGRGLVRIEKNRGPQGTKLFVTEEGARIARDAYPLWLRAQHDALGELGRSFLENVRTCARKAEVLSF